MNYGYSYLHNPVRHPGAESPPIEEMGLTDLRGMLCPKSKGNPTTCISGCPGFPTCKVGQRVAVLSSIAEAPEPELNTNSVRDFFIAACESGNAWNYVMQTLNMSKGAAESRLMQMIKMFPGLAADYGGSRRIMQRPRAVTVTHVGADEKPPEKLQDYHSQEPIPIVETVLAADGRKKAVDERVKRARAMFEKCVASEDPIACYMEERGVGKDSAKAAFKHWEKKFGWIMPAKTAEPESQPEPEKQPEPVEDDTISLADFLSGFEDAEEPNEEPPVNDNPIHREPPPNDVGAVLSDGRMTDRQLRAWAEYYRAEDMRLRALSEVLAANQEAVMIRTEEIERELRWRAQNENHDAATAI